MRKILKIFIIQMDNPEDKNIQNGGNPVVFWISVIGFSSLLFI